MLRFILAAVAGGALAIVALFLTALVGAALVVRRVLGRRAAAAGGEVIDVEAREVVVGKDWRP